MSNETPEVVTMAVYDEVDVLADWCEHLEERVAELEERIEVLVDNITDAIANS